MVSHDTDFEFAGVFDALFDEHATIQSHRTLHCVLQLREIRDHGYSESRSQVGWLDEDGERKFGNLVKYVIEILDIIFPRESDITNDRNSMCSKDLFRNDFVSGQHRGSNPSTQIRNALHL